MTYGKGFFASKNCTASRLKARISFLYPPVMCYLDFWSRSNELFMFLGEKSEAFRITKNNMVALINNERLAKIWNPGNVKLQIRNCKRKNLMLKGSNITASLIWKICDYLELSTRRLRVVPHFFSGIVEREKRERAWKSPHAVCSTRLLGNRVLKRVVIKTKFLKLWDLSGYSERTMSKRPICQKWAFLGKLSLRW